MRKTLSVVCLLAFSLLAQTKPTKDHSKYFPLAVGNEWDYVWELQDEIYYSWTTFVSSILTNGYEVATVSYYRNLQLPILVEKYSNKNLRIMRLGRQYSDGFVPYSSCPIDLVFPLKIGLKWNFETDGGEEYQYKVVKWHETLTTKYGTYSDVFEVEEKMPSVEYYLLYKYYAYGVGLVLEQTADKSKGSRSDYRVLTSYKVR